VAGRWACASQFGDGDNAEPGHFQSGADGGGTRREIRPAEDDDDQRAHGRTDRQRRDRCDDEAVASEHHHRRHGKEHGPDGAAPAPTDPWQPDRGDAGRGGEVGGARERSAEPAVDEPGDGARPRLGRVEHQVAQPDFDDGTQDGRHDGLDGEAPASPRQHHGEDGYGSDDGEQLGGPDDTATDRLGEARHEVDEVVLSDDDAPSCVPLAGETDRQDDHGNPRPEHVLGAPDDGRARQVLVPGSQCPERRGGRDRRPHAA
jgi:hypothetical protein